MFLESEAGAQAGAAGSAAQRPWPGWAPYPGRSRDNIGCFGVFAVLKHNVYYFTVSLLVLLLVGHVTRSGASDWLAAPLSLFCCYLMANKRCRLWACAVLLGRVSCGSCCGWMRSSQRQAVSSSSGSCELFFVAPPAPPVGPGPGSSAHKFAHPQEDGKMSACVSAGCAALEALSSPAWLTPSPPFAAQISVEPFKLSPNKSRRAAVHPGWPAAQLAVPLVCLQLFLLCSAPGLLVEASILRANGGGCCPQHGEEKSLQSLMQAEGGWAPFRPDITILIALMLLLVWAGRGGRGGGAESPVSTAPSAASQCS